MAIKDRKDLKMKDLDGYTATTHPIKYNRHYTRYGVRYTLYPIETVHDNTQIHWARTWLRKNISNGVTASLEWQLEDQKEEYHKLYPPKEK